MERLAMQSNQESSQRYGVLKRRFRRAGIQGFIGDIADGNAVLGGLVADVSSGGFKMTRVTDTFAIEKHSYTTIISGYGKHYKVLAKPCWHKIDTKTHFQEIGFKIIDAPWEWTEFVLSAASDIDYEDDWVCNA